MAMGQHPPFTSNDKFERLTTEVVTSASVGHHVFPLLHPAAQWQGRRAFVGDQRGEISAKVGQMAGEIIH